jgi:hypothetical protein
MNHHFYLFTLIFCLPSLSFPTLLKKYIIILCQIESTQNIW